MRAKKSCREVVRYRPVTETIAAGLKMMLPRRVAGATKKAKNIEMRSPIIRVVRQGYLQEFAPQVVAGSQPFSVIIATLRHRLPSPNW
jgi:hypothetical protein